MDKEIKKNIQASYIPLDIIAATSEHGKIVQSGESCWVDALKDVLAWMPGYVNGWYGWSNDGKGTMLNYLKVLRVLRDQTKKVLLWKAEDMDTVINENGKAEIKANRIYKNLAWTLTGKTWNQGFALRNKCQIMTMEEEMEALKFITKHFYVVYPRDRKFENVMDTIKYYIERFGITDVVIDPWNAMILPDHDRGDERLNNAFHEIKVIAMETNTVWDIVSHPRSMLDVKNKDGSFKVVTQFHQLGGSPWDIKMDGQFSVYRQFRHKSASDPNAILFNLKQREAEIVGVDRGQFPREDRENDTMIFDKIRKQYWFNDVNPITGESRKKVDPKQSTMAFQEAWTPPPAPTDDILF